MSGRNNWRDKREEQHFAHNRKPGRATFWKETRNRFSRRHSRKVNSARVEGKIPTFENEKEVKIKPLGPSKTRPKPPTNFLLEEFLDEEQIDELRNL